MQVPFDSSFNFCLFQWCFRSLLGILKGKRFLAQSIWYRLMRTCKKIKILSITSVMFF
jgi:hypothetical protein